MRGYNFTERVRKVLADARDEALSLRGAVRREQMTLDVSGHYARRDCFEFRVIRNGGRSCPGHASIDV